MGTTVPNWAQTQLAVAVGLVPDQVVVVLDNDTTVVFMHLKSRDNISIRKRDGRITFDKNERKEKPDGSKRERPAGGDEGFL